MKSTSFPRVAFKHFVVLFACVVALAAPDATAQTQPAQRPTDAPARAAAPTPTPSPSATTTATASTENNDLSITANVTARELRFEVVPNPTVEFPGRPRRDTAWEAERTNLPNQVQPGVTYRDIGIRLKITSVFADIERIVAEALGEIPASDSSNNSDTPQTHAPDASAPPDISRAPTAATTLATLTDDASPAVSSTETSPAPSASRARSAKPTPARRGSSRAPARRGRN